MRYSVTKDFLKINETKGTIQNLSNINSVEVSNKAETDSGIFLLPLNKFSFSGTTLFVRCAGEGGAIISVAPFMINSWAGGGSSVIVDDVPETFSDDDVDSILE